MNKILNKFKGEIESKRGSKNIFWAYSVSIKDFLWILSEKLKYILWIIPANIDNYIISISDLIKRAKYDFDVDVVYTYVDNNDPERTMQKKYFSRSLSPNNPLVKESLSPNRFNDYGELKYSLRSIKLFAPWVRNIYIVTPTPNIPWIGLKSNKNNIFIVPNESIFPSKKYLPNFNSSQ